MWLSDADAVQPSGAEAAAARAAAEGRAAAGGGPAGAAAVGWRVGIWWRDDQCFYYGRVDALSADTGARARAGGRAARGARGCRRMPVSMCPGPAARVHAGGPFSCAALVQMLYTSLVRVAFQPCMSALLRSALL